MKRGDLIFTNQYQKWESNPHGHFCPKDFKSLASTVSPFWYLLTNKSWKRDSNPHLVFSTK